MTTSTKKLPPTSQYLSLSNLKEGVFVVSAINLCVFLYTPSYFISATNSVLYKQFVVLFSLFQYSLLYVPVVIFPVVHVRMLHYTRTKPDSAISCPKWPFSHHHYNIFERGWGAITGRNFKIRPAKTVHVWLNCNTRVTEKSVSAWPCYQNHRTVFLHIVGSNCSIEFQIVAPVNGFLL